MQLGGRSKVSEALEEITFGEAIFPRVFHLRPGASDMSIFVKGFFFSVGREAYVLSGSAAY